MLLKSALIVGATFCLVQFACASPAVARSKRQVENSSDEELTDAESALGQLIYVIIVGSLVSCETLASTANTHCDPSILPANLESDKRNHVVSNALRELMEDLRTMEPTQTVYQRVFQLALKPRENATADMWFEALDKAIAEDPALGQRYKELKSNYENLVVLEPNHLEKEKLVSAEEHKKALEKLKPAQELLVTLLFMDRLSADAKDENAKGAVAKKLRFHVLAKTIVEMSKSAEKYEKLQPIYKESISDIATMIVGTNKFETKEVASMLFRKLNIKILADPFLKAEFKEKKKEMLKNLKEKA